VLTKVKLRIMQPNLQQDVKFNYAAKAELMQKYLVLSEPRLRSAIDRRCRCANSDLAGIGVPVFPDPRSRSMAQIADLLPKGTVADHRLGARA